MVPDVQVRRFLCGCWSLSLKFFRPRSFLDWCFQSDPELRPSAATLLDHPFLQQPPPNQEQLYSKMEVVFLGSSLKMSGLIFG